MYFLRGSVALDSSGELVPSIPASLRHEASSFCK